MISDHPFTFKAYHDDEMEYVCLSGVLSLRNFEQAFSELEPLASTPAKEVYVSLRHIQRVDSAGLGFLMRLNSRLRKSGKKMILLDPNHGVMNLLKFSKVDHIIKVESGAAAEQVRRKLEHAEFMYDLNPEADNEGLKQSREIA